MAIVVARPEVSHVPARPWAHARLRKHADFETVYRSGRRLFFAHMTVFFLRRDADPPPQQTKTGFAGDAARVGFTVPRALGSAVERNRIRRRMREAARLNLRAAGQAVDVVIHPKKSALRIDFAELREEIARAFERIQSPVASRQSPADRGEGR